MLRHIGNVTLESGRPKLLTHVGVTYDISTPEQELEKAQAAVSYGTDIIADASLGLNAKKTIELLCSNLECPITCLPGYLLATQHGESELSDNLSSSEILDTTEELFEMGVKGITVHSAILQNMLPALDTCDRAFPFTSRMGNYIKKYMQKTKRENPFFECFPQLVKLAKRYDANISIGLAFRSPTVVNGGGFDELYKLEIAQAGELVKYCQSEGVTTTVEAGGHISLAMLSYWYEYVKETCDFAPLRVLHMPSDRGMGHDNVTGAIGAAFLARLGVEVICTCTRAEHISQPTYGDIVESVVNYKIALAAAHLDTKAEYRVAQARAQGGCHLGQVVDAVIDPVGARAAIKARINAADEYGECTMCGSSCPLK